MVFNICKSLAITVICSTSIGGVFYFFDNGFLKPFILSLIGILVMGFLFGQFTETNAVINNKRLENERIKEFVKQAALTNCAFCNEPNFIPIRLDERNEFICDKCDQKSVVHVSIAASRITTPLDKLNIDIDESEEK
jgi:hypothetical protein